MLAVLPILLLSSTSFADSYSAGSLIIPMDVSFQDSGMLRAYGLVYKLLSSGVPVDWSIEPTKAQNGVDFSAAAKSFKTGASVGSPGYRGGPFIVSSANRTSALPIVQAWQTANAGVAVHEATAAFTAPISQHLVAAPSISVFADGKELIAFGYLNAAGIPQSNGAAWPTVRDTTTAYPGQPDVLNETEVSGPTNTNHADGALFDAAGQPTYCHFLSMHYSAQNHLPEVVAEARSYLTHPGTQYVGECQSATAFNNDPLYGRFLTTANINVDAQPTSVYAPVPSSPYLQFDGSFTTVSGSEPSWQESTRYPTTDILLKGTGSAAGRQEVVFSGFLDGDNKMGHALWLGGHQYTTTLPMSQNWTTQGVRVILNGLLASPCSSATSQPTITVTATGPAFSTGAQATYAFSYTNSGTWPAKGAVLSYTLPAGVSFVSATGGGSFAGGTVTWTVGEIVPGATGSVSVTVNLGLPGTTTHSSALTYKVGLTSFTASSNAVSTVLYAGPLPLTADWIYTEPNGRITDGLAVADLDATAPGSEIVLLASGGATATGRSIVLRSDIGTELSSFTPAAGRNFMGLPLASDLVPGGTLEYLIGETVSLASSGSVYARAGASAGLWTSLPYGWPSYWYMGPVSADVLPAIPGSEVVESDWNGNVKTLQAGTGNVQSSYNTWTAHQDHLYGHTTLADLDGDGTMEASLFGYMQGQLVVLNAEVAPAMTLQWISAPLKTLYGDAAFASGPAVGNIDADPRQEVVVATRGTASDVYAFDVGMPSGSTCEHRWHTAGSYSYTAPVIGDVDGSGQKSVVVLSSTDSTLSILKPGAPGCATAGGTVVWQHTLKVGDRAEFTPILYDVNGDGVLDVIAASLTHLEVVDVRNRVVMLYYDDPTAYFSPSAVVADADPASGVRELYVSGWRNSKVYRLRLPAAATSPNDWPTYMGNNARTGSR